MAIKSAEQMNLENRESNPRLGMAARGVIFELPKVAQTNSNQAIELLRVQSYSLSQRQRYVD